MMSRSKYFERIHLIFQRNCGMGSLAGLCIQMTSQVSLKFNLSSFPFGKFPGRKFSDV